MTELFDRDVRTINEHLKNLYVQKELSSGGNTPEFPECSQRSAGLLLKTVEVL